ncbi:adenylate/guanylate cyclase domain-containing protein [Acinetobacter bouvetii]|uniref:Adenylate and Guanylate cyclase catalytic domain protein n=1 Tax=Acinetobacter bouvetii TaxID=202951 RepID=A0A811GDK1_9GAMM|nr:adenylate/guanylate cyclase domain-containing protein [Acinetobacter bouvetii]CAB1218968.1 Adenylate and Guanylate cyclase catalytic domain protein [Acinetobacter bouvetii]
MQANYKVYDFEKSRERIDEILDSSDNNYQESNKVPSIDDLTYNNGYHINCSALFIDLRGSKELATKHQKKVLAKIYRAYISELVALLNGNLNIQQIYIEGDCVWGVFNTETIVQINEVFNTAAKANSLIHTLNIKLKKKNYTQLKVGIGLHYGQALVIKAGYKGSGINEVTWIGELIGKTAQYCNDANKGWRKPIILSDVFHQNLNDDNKKLCNKVPYTDFHECDVINTLMDTWVQDNG